ncbi:GTPase for tRNA modification and thiophene and furan oxidation [Candidatus Blochmanniella floridana]|uniref:tRNA modification GTPase MnmE n=1 Tax=Blochmanniella floridana TaxID=203907 RepID=MNME_BLOFL|nr:RecName: Full=tRNA modification GTPase MnmE [Candidatus Blochmannia floridanus]CAD83539.1 GTPase for tRNA modification and thiophene and furan oxidation [Candidatus Blochmannia floridanus]
MKNNEIDTIAAISTPIGRGGIGIIRVSGKLVPEVAMKLFNKIPKPRTAEYLTCIDHNGSIMEKVITLFFPEPHSFTGENILEIHGHGGQMILDLLLDRILNISSRIRLANPGEFTERAFLNEKIDLIQAESIADIINATSYQAAKSACNSLQGHFSNQIRIILNKITNFRTYIESTLDFSDQEISDISYQHIYNTLQNIIDNTNQICKLTHSGVLLRDGIKVVIAGKPNAGKSSLFNSLINKDRAIISNISGTTRDILHEYIQLNGIAFHIIDTAGFKKNSTNEIELIGMQKSKYELSKADHILWVIDSTDYSHNNSYNNIINSLKKELSSNNIEAVFITIIRNKSDLSFEHNGIDTTNKYACITLSALLNHGIDLLKKHLYDSAMLQIHKNSNFSSVEENQGNFIARKRHLKILQKVFQYLLSAKTQLQYNMTVNDCFAEDLKKAHEELAQIFGKLTPDDLLEEIFRAFCIGK